jgi:hypothetical protein
MIITYKTRATASGRRSWKREYAWEMVKENF